MRIKSKVVNLAVFSVFTALATVPTYAEQNGAKAPSGMLLRSLTPTREQSIANLFRQFRRFAGDDNVLEPGDGKDQLAFTEAIKRSQAMLFLMNKDLNGDMVVSKAERNAKGLNYNGYVNKKLEKKLDSYDTDKDGRIEFAEAYRYLVTNPGNSNSIAFKIAKRDQVTQYLDLLPANAPKRLTADMLEKIGRNAFAYFDVNGDGVLREDELEKLQAAKRKKRFGLNGSARRSPTGKCALPKPGVRDQIVVASLYNSKRLSTVALGDQSVETQTTTMNIEKGTRPLFIIVRAEQPNILNFTGHTERVSHVVGLGRRFAESKPMIGVLGIDAAKISFQYAGDCFGAFTKPTSTAAKLANSVIKGIVGRRVNRTVGSHMMAYVDLPSGRVANCGDTLKRKNKDLYSKRCGLAAPVSEGKTNTHKQLRRFNAGGLARFEAGNVVSDESPASYKVLPNYAGLLQLIGEGSIEELPGGGYFVKKPIPAYPAGLAGSLSTRFVFAKGIKPPDGTAGSSCIKMEDGTQVASLTSSIFCRRFPD